LFVLLVNIDYDNSVVSGTVIQKKDLMDDVICVNQLDTDSFLISYKSMYSILMNSITIHKIK